MLTGLARTYSARTAPQAQPTINRGSNQAVTGRPSQTQGTQASQTQTPPQRAAPLFTRDTFTPAESPSTGSTPRIWRDPVSPSRTYNSQDGVPLFNQGDPAWGTRRLGGTGPAERGSDIPSIGTHGCAITSVAMALSQLSGRTITPQQMDEYLDNNKGYSGNSVFFPKTTGILGGSPEITANRLDNLTIAQIDRELDEKRPVAIGVRYGGTQGRSLSGTPDHWITLTGKNEDGTYRANDPNGGVPITLRREGTNGLMMAPREGRHRNRSYHFRNHGVTFTPPPVAPARGSDQDGFVDRAVSRQARPTIRAQPPQTP